MTDRACMRLRIHAHTNERTNTDTKLLLSKIIVERSPVINDAKLFEVHFFIIFLNHLFANSDTAFSKKVIPKRNSPKPQRNSMIP